MQRQDRIYGLRAIMEAIESNKAVDKVFIQRGLTGDLAKQLEGLVHKKGISTSYVPVEKLNRLSKNNHQGAVAQISPVDFVSFEEMVETTLEKQEKPIFLLLDNISDVRNFGAIIRTAECTGVAGIIIPKQGAAPINSDAIKTSAGAAFRVPIAKVDHLKDAIYYLQSSNIPIVAATEKTEQSLYELPLDQAVAIIMGAEDVGVSPAILKLSDHQAKLPLMGEIGSLNVSVACGVLLYEVIRQRMG